MGESGLQHWVSHLLFGLLRSFFSSAGQQVVVGGNQFFYVKEGDNTLRVAPDIYVIPDEDTPIDMIKSWKLWEHGGKGPALAIEVVSDEYEKDYDAEQLALYQRLGVSELLRYDPEHYLHLRARKFGPRRLLTHWVRDSSGLLVERPLVDKGCAKSAIFDFFFVHVSPRSLRLGVGPRGRSLWPTESERAAAESERAAAESERAARAEEELNVSVQEVTRLRQELERLRK